MVSETPQGYFFDVLKKSTPDGKLSIYLDRRTFIDHFDYIDPIDGVLTISKDVRNTDHVFLILTCAYRYGRDDLDVLGLTFQKEILIYTQHLWPTHVVHETESQTGDVKWHKKWRRLKRNKKKKTDTTTTTTTATAATAEEEMKYNQINNEPFGIFSQSLKDSDLSPFQARLKAKYTEQAVPFRVILPPSSPSSVAIQPNQGETHKPYGVTYELTAFVGKKIDDNQPTCSTVTIVVRKLIAGPKLPNRPIHPVVESIKKTISLACYSGELHIKASIEKPLYFHDEPICISVVLDNFSQLAVRKLQIAVVQAAEMYLLTKGVYRSTIDGHYCKENLPQAGQQDWRYTITLGTSLTDKLLKRGVALDGFIRQEKNWLASSTILKLSSDLDSCLQLMQNVNTKPEENLEATIKTNKELHGIVISYCVRVRCWIGIR
uniref:Arrestin_C domain-containing protein n=1 Tax=Trichobilharzia regenti TaxID=157069 RepID=A0AA85JXA9_TRIRE|nr:unnamed protein product [Trichobilharzia regenti]